MFTPRARRWVPESGGAARYVQLGAPLPIRGNGVATAQADASGGHHCMDMQREQPSRAACLMCRDTLVVTWPSDLSPRAGAGFADVVPVVDACYSWPGARRQAAARVVPVSGPVSLPNSCSGG